MKFYQHITMCWIEGRGDKTQLMKHSLCLKTPGSKASLSVSFKEIINLDFSLVVNNSSDYTQIQLH